MSLSEVDAVKSLAMSIDGLVYVKSHYLDASALVKLVANDNDELPGREVLRKYYWANTANMYATPYSIAETFGVFKSKWLRKKIDRKDYLKYSDDFATKILGTNLRIDTVAPPYAPIVRQETARLVTGYGIDWVDSFQLVALKHGQFSTACGLSQSIFITGDKGLAKAGRAEGLRVWDCINELAPPM